MLLQTPVLYREGPALQRGDFTQEPDNSEPHQPLQAQHELQGACVRHLMLQCTGC